MRLSCLECKVEFDAESILAAGVTCPGCGKLVSAREVFLEETEFAGTTAAASHGDTEDWSGPPTLSNGRSAMIVPKKIGRYIVRRLLGGGGFGWVYLAYDESLDRHVAIKTFWREKHTPGQLERILDEARITAGLKHPQVVSVFDFGHTDDGSCFLVLEYIEGRSLASLIHTGPISPERAADLLIEVAATMHYAHEQGFVHRDLKPANIFLDAEGRPHVGDFGLAAHEDRLRWLSSETSGTPAYMAPEQVRGENHRIDRRTDIWSLGIILYEMLIGRRPYASGGNRSVLFGEILYREAKPPRQIDNRIPRALEQVCLKCLSKRMADRYATAAELAADLRYWRGRGDQATVDEDFALPETWLTTIVPKSLHSFDAEDSDFFLELLPGPRDRDGLPESIRFWKTRIEETDPDRTFSVGLLFGPSGCGKTSLVRAGLLPRIETPHLVAYVEATPDATELRLLARLRKLCPRLDPTLGLVDTLAMLRLEEELTGGKKVLIVLDQFEQWLHAKRTEEDRELVRALRQCDGKAVQGLVMVRDDFGMLAAQFMDELEIPIVQGFNFATVDLFDRKHARKVLLEFGRAFGQLPADPDSLEPEQARFLDDAVSGLAEDGKILCVRLALFAEVVKSKPWVPATLRAIGGVGGIGSTFLEEMLGDGATNPEYRRHQKAARAVLKTLLPDSASPIKGHKRSWRELLEASGYGAHPEDFDHLLRILDSELRLVAPSDPGDVDGAGDDTAARRAPEGRYYQLTHDYLVQALHRWLGRKQRETWRGRAELCLEERTAQWKRSRQDRFLPSLPEYLSIEFGVRRALRGPEHRALIQAARRHHGKRAGLALLVGLLVIVGIRQYVVAVRDRAERNLSKTLVQAVITAPPDAVPYTIEDLLPFADRVKPLLRARLRDASGEPPHRLHAAFALAALGDLHREFLVDAIAHTPSNECRNFVAAFARAPDQVRGLLMRRLRERADPDAKMRYATVLLYLGDPEGVQQVLQILEDPTIRRTFIHRLGEWHADFRVLSNVLEKSDDGPLRSGVCAALGLIDPESLPKEERNHITDVLTSLYQTAPDGGTHGASGWALRRWGVELPAIAPSEGPSASKEWFVTKSGLTMVRIAPGRFMMGGPSPSARPHPVTLTRPFLVSDREVSVDLYRQYLDSSDGPPTPLSEAHQPDRAISPALDDPAQTMSWIDAALFCNWLSRREGKRPCYRRTGETKTSIDAPTGKAMEMEIWACDFSADGYRLPTEAEWEYACRASAATLYSFGNEDEWLSFYCIFSRSYAARRGEKLPNAWGLFDMHGNVREWCWDWSGEYPQGEAIDPTGPSVSTLRIQRGGSWYDLPRACRSGERNGNNPLHTDNLLGCRVVCTAPAE